MEVPHKVPYRDGCCEECQEELDNGRKTCHFCSNYYQSFKFGDYPTACKGCYNILEKRGMYRSTLLCGECWAKKLREEKRKKLNGFQEKLELLQQKETNDLTAEDYSEILKKKKEIEKLNYQYESIPFKSEIKEFLQKLEQLKERFPQRIRLKFQNKSKFCRHQNIYWNDFFKPFKEKNEEPYCLDCGEDEGARFTESFQKWYCSEINKWLKKNKGLDKFAFANFLKKKDYYDNWCDLRTGKFYQNIKDELTFFQEMSCYIEEYCLEFIEEQKGGNKNKDNNIERERERERERESKTGTGYSEFRK